MAYETGTPTSCSDLLDKLRVFAIAQGWTVNRWVTAGSGKELCLSKSTSYFNLRSYENESVFVNGSTIASKTGIAINGSDSYNAGAAWDRQPGYPIRYSGTAGSDQQVGWVPMVITIGPFSSYQFFASDSKTIYCEIEIKTNVFLRFGFGALDLFNPSAPGGGRFFYATGGMHVTNATTYSSWLGVSIDDYQFQLEHVPFRSAGPITPLSGVGQSGSMVRAAFGSFDGWATSFTYAPTSVYMAATGGDTYGRILRAASANPLNQSVILCPITVAINPAGNYLIPIGNIPAMRYLDITNYNPKDEVALGSDTWRLYPWYQKGALSLQRGIAYKKVA